MLKYVLSKNRLFIEEIDNDVLTQDVYTVDGDLEQEILYKLSQGGYELGVINEVLQAIPIKKYVSEFYTQAEINNTSLLFLNQTDWLSSKYVDTVIINKTLTEEQFTDKYKDLIEQREQARSKIQDLSLLQKWQ